jgi:ABC-2 type transport system ATP-binding protein
MNVASLREDSPAISLHDLRKVYQVTERESGVKAALISIFNRKIKDIVSVDDLSFDVASGEIVGFLGPNGAGKTTTIKMLAGLLHPSGGAVHVLGQVPWKRKRELLRQITLIMGQRNQLQWDLPSMDSYEFLRAIYEIPYDSYKKTLNELTEMLEIGAILNKPVRNLSLGERMKCEIAGALLHRPSVVFLDEPSIGLDVAVQHRLRNFIAEYNRLYGATVLLTSHYVPDVEVLCKRVIFINQGKMVYDGQLSKIADRILPYRTVVLQLSGGQSPPNLESYGKVLENVDGRVKLEVAKAQTASVTSRLLADLPVNDLSVVDPPIEEVIRYMFNIHEDESAELSVKEAAV